MDEFNSVVGHADIPSNMYKKNALSILLLRQERENLWSKTNTW